MYDESFFESRRDVALTAARAIVPRLLALYRPQSVVDVGCGDGTWLLAFTENGVTDVTGIDGAYVDPASLLIPSHSFLAHDLGTPLSLDRTFDLAVCLEVVEHLAPPQADQLVKALCKLAPVIFFSGAIPGQWGTNHVNCQWPWYWHERFRAAGYEVLDPLRPQIMYDSNVAFWYRQNCFLMVRRDVLAAHAALAAQPVVPAQGQLVLVVDAILQDHFRLRPTLRRVPGLLARAVRRRLGLGGEL